MKNKKIEIGETEIQEITDDILTRAQLRFFLKREDAPHPIITTNKFRKLKYNILAMREQRMNKILTFGGAFSNHILATAYAGSRYGFDTIGVIRGADLVTKPLNPVLQAASNLGMKLHFISRELYRKKHESQLILSLRKKFGIFYLIPEGGANLEGVRGCIRIPKEIEIPYDFICCPCGTGTTLAGIILGLKKFRKALGFSVLNSADGLEDTVYAAINEVKPKRQLASWNIFNDYHFGGYAKQNSELHRFMERFEAMHSIKIEPIYAGKMLYGIFDLVKKGYFPINSTIIALYTGGLPFFIKNELGQYSCNNKSNLANFL